MRNVLSSTLKTIAFLTLPALTLSSAFADTVLCDAYDGGTVHAYYGIPLVWEGNEMTASISVSLASPYTADLLFYKDLETSLRASVRIHNASTDKETAVSFFPLNSDPTSIDELSVLNVAGVGRISCALFSTRERMNAYQARACDSKRQNCGIREISAPKDPHPAHFQ